MRFPAGAGEALGGFALVGRGLPIRTLALLEDAFTGANDPLGVPGTDAR
jgi:hypothetical protein